MLKGIKRRLACIILIMALIGGVFSGDLSGVTVNAAKPPVSDPTPQGTSISRGNEWLWLLNGTGTQWLSENFVPSGSWVKSSSPIGYGYTGVNNVPSGNCSNVYLRRILNISDMSTVKSVVMNLSLDDSATVYFNGVQAAATFNQGGTIDKSLYETGDVRVLPNGLHVGKNIISVNLINTSSTSSDIYFNMSLVTSEQDIGFQGNKFVMTPGSNPSEMGFAWYTPYARGPESIYFIPNTPDEVKYSTVLQGQINGEGGRFHDGNAKSIYKIPLDLTQSQATVVIDISQNYTIELSGNGTTWGPIIADPALAGVGQCGGNRHKEILDISSYITSGFDYIYIRIGDQTTSNGWGGIVFSIERVSGAYPPAYLSGAVIQIAKKVEMNGDIFPSNAQIVGGTTVAADGSFASNKVTVTGLLFSTEYSYRYGNSITNQWSPVYTFITGAGDMGYKAIFMGDPQIGGSGNAVSDGIGFNNNLNKAIGLVPDARLILSAGDQVDHSSESEYDALLKADQLKKIPFVPAYGNHDANNPSFSNHYNLPNMTGLGTTGAGSDYYFSYGNTLIMVVNGNNENIAEHRQAMLAAIASDSDAKWRIVLMHQDVYGAGAHASEDPSIGTSTVRLRQNLVPVFEELGVDIVLNGHDHSYARSHIMKNQTPQLNQVIDENGAMVDPDGILYITANCSSTSKFYGLVGNPSYVAVKYDIRVPQFSTLEVTDTQFAIKTYRSDTMTVIDEVKISKPANAMLAAA